MESLLHGLCFVYHFKYRGCDLGYKGGADLLRRHILLEKPDLVVEASKDVKDVEGIQASRLVASSIKAGGFKQQEG